MESNLLSGLLNNCIDNLAIVLNVCDYCFQPYPTVSQIRYKKLILEGLLVPGGNFMFYKNYLDKNCNKTKSFANLDCETGANSLFPFLI